MAQQETSPTPTAQVVGHAFVTQYYHILHQSPEYVYKFYQETSSLSRPDCNGVMPSVTTMKEINDKILSFEYGTQKAEIETSDAQESYNKGVIVLVTGCLTGNNYVRTKFAQTFFLAPQEKGYFVLNDVLRYIDNVSSEADSMPVSDPGDTTQEDLSPSDPELILDCDHPTQPAGTAEADVLSNSSEVYELSNHDDGSVVDEEVVNDPPVHTYPIETNRVVTSDSSAPQEEKKSYASIVKVTKVRKPTAPIYVPTNRTKVVPKKADQPLYSPINASPNIESSSSANDHVPESSTTQGEGHSIYIRNLPLSASIEQLEEEFKKFGSIKPNGVQVKSNKQQGYCFGFVEFESLDSMLAAIQASPVTIGDCESAVEEKRNTRGGGSGSGRYVSGRGGFRSENSRGRGNFNRTRSYGRDNMSGRTSRGGPGGRGGEGYRRVDQRGGHQGGDQ